MDARYYEILRQASQEDFYSAINDPEDELYDLFWDLFDKLVVEPAEVFDSDFRDNNQFRFGIGSAVTMEFFPEQGYYRKRIESNPFNHDEDPAGIHLQLLILPGMSCLFSVGFLIWGAAERQAFRILWRTHRRLLNDLLHRSKPMVSTAIAFPEIERSRSIEEMLDSYFAVKDTDNYLGLHYPFAQDEESETAQNFMVSMALLYYSVRSYCKSREDRTVEYFDAVKQFYRGHVPELPVPLPCVDLGIETDAGQEEG